MSLGEWLGVAALIVAVALAVLLAIQSSRLSRIERRLASLSKGAGPGSAGMSFGDLVADQAARLENVRADLERLRATVATLEQEAEAGIQNVGLVRFNPFQETGGDQSFALALLNKSGNGIVMSSLHSRNNTRVYAKPVKNGAPQGSLSDEETQAFEQAMHKG